VPWRYGGSGPTGHAFFYGVAGRSYTIRGRAVDRAGNASGLVTATVSFAANATRVQPFKSLYTINQGGDISAVLTPPTIGPRWSFNVVRGLAAAPNGVGGYVLDLYGGLHPFGGAPSLSTSWYQPGWDIARGVALNPDGVSGYVLDGFGGLHAIGGATASIPGAPYWGGWDIARAVVMAPTSTAAKPAGYILDGWGSVHEFGGAPPLAITGYWRGWDIAHALALNPDGKGGYVLDGFGGLHPIGNASGANGAYWPGWDIARGLVSLGNGANAAGYVLDGLGGLHPFGSAPIASPGPAYWGTNVAKAVAAAR
jgi:hypothetical protein